MTNTPEFKPDDTDSSDSVPTWEAEGEPSVAETGSPLAEVPAYTESEQQVALSGIRKVMHRVVDFSSAVGDVSWSMAKAFFTGDQG